MTWHQVRHIHSSLVNDLPGALKIAQEQLGHAAVSTTLSIYTHVVDTSRRKAVEAVEERLTGKMDFGLDWTSSRSHDCERLDGRPCARTCAAYGVTVSVVLFLTP